MENRFSLDIFKGSMRVAFAGWRFISSRMRAAVKRGEEMFVRSVLKVGFAGWFNNQEVKNARLLRLLNSCPSVDGPSPSPKTPEERLDELRTFGDAVAASLGTTTSVLAGYTATPPTPVAVPVQQQAATPPVAPVPQQATGSSAPPNNGSTPKPHNKRCRAVKPMGWREWFGIDRYQAGVVLERTAASVHAGYHGVSLDEEPDVVCNPVDPLGWLERRIYDASRAVFGGTEKSASHAVRHRAINRFNSRMPLVREIVQAVKFKHCFTGSDALEMKAIGFAASSVIAKMIDEGRIHKASANWYKMATVACYFIVDEDEQLCRLVQRGGPFTIA